MNDLPDWMYAPRVEGWFAEDLDNLPQAPPHTELLHGALVFRLARERSWHSRVVAWLVAVLEGAAPVGVRVENGMTVTLDTWNRLEPDVLVSDAAFDPDRTWYTPAEVLLAVEVLSPESEGRDRGVKFRKYAEAGIPHYWIVEEVDGRPVVHVYELERTLSAYAPAGIFRGRVERPVPWPMSIDVGCAAD